MFIYIYIKSFFFNNKCLEKRKGMKMISPKKEGKKEGKKKLNKKRKKKSKH